MGLLYQSEELIQKADIIAGKIIPPKGIDVSGEKLLWTPSLCVDEEERETLISFAKRVVDEIPGRIQSYTDLKLGRFLVARYGHENTYYAGWVVKLTSYHPIFNRVVGQKLHKLGLNEKNCEEWDLDDLVKQIVFHELWTIVDKHHLDYLATQSHPGFELESQN